MFKIIILNHTCGVIIGNIVIYAAGDFINCCFSERDVVFRNANAKMVPLLIFRVRVFNRVAIGLNLYGAGNRDFSKRFIRRLPVVFRNRQLMS